MAHDTALLGTMAVGLGLAFVLGFLARRLRLPPLVGYLLAGVAIGPFTPGFVGDMQIAPELAELGVILLMFGVGIHFSLGDLLAVRRIAVPGAVVQIALATILGAAVAHFWWGWSWSAGVVFGLCLSVASTVVLLRALEDRRALESPDGRIAVGWLIVEDLATVLVLVVLPAFALQQVGTGAADEAARAASEGSDLATVGESIGGDAVAAMSTTQLLAKVGVTLAKVGAFVALMVIVGRRAVPWLLERVARTGSRELFTLAVLAIALGIAFGSAALFGVSVALGAFFAGTVVNGSKLSHKAATDALPLQDAFSVLFFVAVGMLFDPSILVRQPLEVFAIVLIVIFGKSIGAFGIVLAFRYPLRTALRISASLAQVGEFSFILAALGVSLGLLPAEGQSLIVAAALLSIGLNPLAFLLIDRIDAWATRRQAATPPSERAAPATVRMPNVDELHGHAIIVGFGGVGSTIADVFKRKNIPYVAIEQDRAIADAARARGLPVLVGDATRPGVLREARVQDASVLVVTTREPFQTRALLETARADNPHIQTIVRTHTDDERSELERRGVDMVVVGENELALALARYGLVRMGWNERDADATIDETRRRHRPESAVPQPPMRLAPE